MKEEENGVEVNFYVTSSCLGPSLTGSAYFADKLEIRPNGIRFIASPTPTSEAA